MGRRAKMMCGGTGDEKPADESVQKHCDAVKADVEKHLNKIFDVFEAKSYKSQVVAGTNFFVKSTWATTSASMSGSSARSLMPAASSRCMEFRRERTLNIR